jgi:tetratricopeptide (TPR) repeat protein
VNLGEAPHLLANRSEIHFWRGEALAAAGRFDDATAEWTAAASASGDFQSMSVQPFSEMTYSSALALRRLRRAAEANRLLRSLLRYALELARRPARIDYFATSLPSMLLFDDDLQERQRATARFLEAQARMGLGERARARHLLRTILRLDPNHELAAELLTVKD